MVIKRKNITRQQEDKEDLAAVEKALAEPGLNIPWEKVKKDLDQAYRLARNLAKEARRQLADAAR